MCLLTENCIIQQTHIFMDDTRFLQYSNTRLLIQITWPLTITKPQSQTSHSKMIIICDADLHSKFRNNPHEKKLHHYFYEVKQQSDSTARSVVWKMLQYIHTTYLVSEICFTITAVRTINITQRINCLHNKCEIRYTKEIILHVITKKKAEVWHLSTSGWT